jgi:hypothetical protein
VPLPGDWALASIELLQQEQSIVNGSAVNGGVIDGDAVLSHHFFKISQAQVIDQVPPDAQQDHRVIEMTTFEQHAPPELTRGVGRTELLNGLRQISA